MPSNTSLLAPLAILSIVASHVCVVYLLAYKRSRQPPYSHDAKDVKASKALQRVIRALTSISAVSTLVTPHSTWMLAADPLLQCGLRVLCFFYACKLLDLGLTKAEEPPTRLVRKHRRDDNTELQPAPMRTYRDLTAYAWLLLTEMRYRSFDIAVKQKGRPDNASANTASDRKQRLLWTGGPIILLPTLAILLPSPATKCAVLLMVIQYGLEGVHTLLHPYCPEPVFYRPFAAGSLSEFWSTNWHAGASPFLQSLAYKPARKATGSRAYEAVATGIAGVGAVCGVWGWVFG
ncbi:hypothetical protein B0A55_09872 [Friedmanniomyces simplex]|uniref:Wax synthase domain-containing protein n=1 Tax=Friedmanniomyces simplex TaxID=329884 RepID=A0A4U0WLY4_9PEZI|nr:hypothetical protein B0A55_09872 [Friedmanniomyces simplex]